jgi:gliding motility-associated-like protein
MTERRERKMENNKFYMTKRLHVSILIITIFLGLSSNVSAQINLTPFWLETFGLGQCNQGQFAFGAIPTSSNGQWNSAAIGPQGAQANEWFISSTEAGRPVGQCNDGCLNNAGLTNQCLHIAANLAPPNFDPGAIYIRSASSNTNKRATTPVINCLGKNNITLQFNYAALGTATTDACEVFYSASGSGGPWISLGVLAPTPGTCPPLSQWTAQSYPLPASADGNPNVALSFVWTNTNVPNSPNISVAIDDITLLSPQITYSAMPQNCANFPWSPIPTNTVAGVTSFTWSASPGGVTFNTVNPNPTPTITCPSPGIYTFVVEAYTGAALTSSVTFTANVVGALQFTASATPTPVCPNQTVTLNVVGGTNHTWTPGPLFGTPNNVTPTVSTIYTVNGTDFNGCPGSATVFVPMGPFPNISVVATATAVCIGFQSTLTAAGAGSYTWNGTGISPPVQNSSVVVGPGNYTVVAILQGIMCPAYQYVTISNAPPLNIQVSSSPQTATTCIASNFPLTSNAVNLCATGAGVYNWSPQSSLNYSIGPCVSARPLVSTCYTVTGFTSVCSGSAIVCVTVIPQFSMNVIPKQPYMCVGDSISLFMAQITSSHTPYKFYWFEPQNAPPPSMTNNLSQTVVISPTNMSQPVTYSAEVVDSWNCASVPKLVPVTVLPQPLTAIAIPTINGIATNSICYVGSSTGSNPEAIIELDAVNSNSPVLPLGVQATYTWTSPYPMPYTPSSILTPANEFSVILAAPLRTPSPVTFTLQSGYNGIPVDGKGCKRIDTVSLRVVDCRSLTSTSASYTTAIPNDTICSRNCVTFVNLTDTAAGGPQTYTWVCRGGQPSVSTQKDPTICYNLPGVYNVVLYAHSPYNPPKGSDDFEARMNYIKVVDVPNPKILPAIVSCYCKDTTIRYGQSITLTATNAASYVWDPNYNVSSTTGNVITVTPRKTTQYHVWGYNSKQCFSSDTITIRVTEDCGEVFVPNAFSPNDDGNNDVLKVRGFCLESMTFMVFNKWGEKVFETNDKEKGWDGNYKDQPMNTDVFVWRLEGKRFDGKAYFDKGNVTLVR